MDEFHFNSNNEKEIIQDGITKIAQIFHGLFSKEEIEEKLKKNQFNGFYIVDEEEYIDQNPNPYSKACYNNKTKSIYARKDYLDEKVIIHELIHAFYDGKINKNILEETINSYGSGLEEGIVSIITNSSNIENIEGIKSSDYIYQSYIVRQLNDLYKSYRNQKYDNLIIHSLKEPEDLLPLISRIYSDIIEKNYPNVEKKEIQYLSLRCSMNLISILDETIEIEDFAITAPQICYNCEEINALLLSLENNKVYPSRFLNYNVFKNIEKKYRVQSFVSTIFDNNLTYKEFVINELNDLTSKSINIFDDFDNVEKMKIKKINE